MTRTLYTILFFCSFIYAQTPQIDSFSPTFGEVEDLITITGNNFNTTPSNNFVFFGSVKANVVSASLTQLVVEVPKSATHDFIFVSTNGYSAQTKTAFSVVNPLISNNNITGNNFGNNIVIPSLGGQSSPKDMTIAVGDLDLDGKVDVIVNSNGLVRVHRNLMTSEGTISNTSFDAGTDFVINGNPHSVVARDVNSDGKLDIITGGSTISVLINNSSVGNISFETKIDLTSGGDVVKVADVNNDGLVDVFTTTTSSLNVYLNSSTGGVLSFDPVQSISLSATGFVGLAYGDLNNDGSVDVVVSKAGVVEILYNDYEANSTFTSAGILSNGGVSSIIGDFDNDGDNDIYSTNGSIFENTYTSGVLASTDFEEFDNSYEEGASSLSLSDIDGDNKLEIIGGTNWDKAWVMIVSNLPLSDTSIASRWYPRQDQYCGSCGPTLAVDVDGDNKVDVISSVRSGAQFNVTQNIMQPSPSITYTESFTSFESCSGNASNSQNSVVSGEYLTADISINAPSGYEVSTDNSTFSSSLTLSQSSGTVAETTIYLRLTGASTGDFNSNISITSQNATSVEVALTGTVYESPVISGSSSIEYNTTTTLTATTTPSAPSPWSSSNTSVGTITDSGEFSAIALGTTTISFENSNGCIDTFEVNVVDSTAPVITLTGDATVTLEVGVTYTDLGATATDNYDTSVTVTVGGDTVDTTTVGTYTVTYNASDAAGNNATEVTRTVNVVDSTAPVITLTGEATVTLEVGATYTDLGATATDNYDTSVTVTVGGDTVDTTTVGTYTVTYNASDAAGNNATEVTRTVNVVESLSVHEVNEIKLSVYPNPTSTHWYIKANNEIKSISLYDISGRKILHKRPFNKNVEINTQSLPSGVYILTVNKINTIKLLKL